MSRERKTIRDGYTAIQVHIPTELHTQLRVITVGECKRMHQVLTEAIERYVAAKMGV